MHDVATYFAWLVLAVLLLVAVAVIVWLGSLPKKIALRRNHPQVDAINACSWIGLAAGGIGWPIAFVWSFLRAGPIGHERAGTLLTDPAGDQLGEIAALKQRIQTLERQLRQATSNTDPS